MNLPTSVKTSCYRHGGRHVKVEKFDAIATPLHTGISLIEASAGTGKTYTIAMLVLRLVVESDLPIEKILVVTFTKAATEELKDRIRSRLADAKRILAGTNNNNDAIIDAWLRQTNLTTETIKRRLDNALLDIDQAGIFTIHGFCQRVLKEHALASGQLFDAELTEDLATIKQACADDFWRRNIQNRPSWEAAILSKDLSTPDALLGSLSFVPEDAAIYPENKNLDAVLIELKQATEQAKTFLKGYSEKLNTHFEGKSFKDSYKTKFLGHIDSLDGWLNGYSAQLPSAEALSLLAYDGIYDGLNGTQFRSNKNQTSDQRKSEFMAVLAINTQPFDELADKMRYITVILRRNLLETLRTELDKQLEQLNVWSFDSLISHLAKALRGERPQYLIDELRQRFHAALIDEFQDTDNNQWHIFSTLFATENHRLMLVGDPKQAIYKFRGADIYSYLEAQTQAQHRYTLGNNWRSHPQLVDAVNRLFQREHAFLLPDIAFHPTQAALTGFDGALTQNGADCAAMILWQLPKSESSSGHWQSNKNEAAQAVRVAVANEIVELLNGDYHLEFPSKSTKRKILPQDIAILVRTNQQAREYQAILRLVSVPSVLNSTESVFTSEEALHLYTLLLAVAHPGDINLLGQALALSWFGYDGQSLYKLLNNESEIDKILAEFLGYFQLWQQHGVMTMMQSLLTQEKIVPVLAASELDERRLTNLQHALELVQQAVIDQHLGIHKTLNWLKSAITKAVLKPSGADNQQLRLESDADAVKIITLHRAKGLEYPIVFCPNLWQGNQRTNSKNPLVKYHLPDTDNAKANRLIVDLGSDTFEEHQTQAQFEERAEDIRLVYVALTRAKYRCYLAWADSRTEDKPNQSALAYLLNFAEQDFSGQQTILQGLQTENAKAFAYRLLTVSDQLVGHYLQPDTNNVFSARKRRRSLYTNWQMSSYTALSALSLSDSPELPNDKADETHNSVESAPDYLPLGAQTGNVLHELLEKIPFIDLANKRDISELREKSCQRYGLKLEQPDKIDELLYNTVVTPLSTTDRNFCLAAITDNQCLKEMPFYLSMPIFNTRALNRILQNQPTFQSLAHKQMHGFLTGYIDLICEYDGRFYVMDYKSNTLSDYGNEALIQAMREHNYGLQSWLYSVVLHRYLQQRLPAYRFNDHFGGVRYLFVRGMKPEIPMGGVYENRPALATIEQLSALFEE